jgi:Family of unknown function (DUF6510)
MERLKLDGNAAAGTLQDVFAHEVTAAAGTCDGCGAVEPIGALALYAHAPGLVLRCPHCHAVMIRLVTDGERYWLDLRGVRLLESTSR